MALTTEQLKAELAAEVVRHDQAGKARLDAVEMKNEAEHAAYAEWNNLKISCDKIAVLEAEIIRREIEA